MVAAGESHPPPGEPLEELLGRGAAVAPIYLAHLPASTERFRAVVLLGVLSLGSEVVTVVRERIRRRDSPEKLALLRGLGEIGHPDAEGYFTRVLRERHSVDAAIQALRSLGNIRGSRSLPSILEALAEPALTGPACESLVRFGTPPAIAALEQRQDELPAFRALASLGAACARDAYLARLGGDPEWAEAAALGVGRLGDPALGGRLLPLLSAGPPGVRRAAFEAYTALGAPAGSGPVLELLQRESAPWMLPALGSVPDPAVHDYLVDLLAGEERERKGILRRLFSRSRRVAEADRRAAARALRDATDPRVLERVGGLILEEDDPVVVRHLLAVRGLLDLPRQRDRVAEVWGRDELLLAHAAGLALLQNPTRKVLGEVLDFLARPGFLPLDTAKAGADREHQYAVYGSDNNPALLVSAFVDSGFLDLGHLAEALGERVAAWDFPEDTDPASRFSRPEDGDVGPFLQALGEARPGEREALHRLWGVLAELEAQGESLLDLFLSHTGVHRGGMQRELFAGYPSAVAKFIEGKTDQDLGEIDTIAAHLPAEGPLRGPLGEVLERARLVLRAECRDIAMVVEGSVRSDMVLIEKL